MKINKNNLQRYVTISRVDKHTLPLFDSVFAVEFVVDLTSYRRRLFSDHNSFEIHQHLQFFREIANSKFLANSAIILWLNKADLFAEYLKETPLSVAFPEYIGGNGSFMLF
jgi:guanine nucleotide-binding protein G(i) subunit alpha